MMATAFMGYVLPWGQMSFWGATVITGFFTAFPIVGEPIQQLLLGGFAVDNPTLNRFFSLHYLLPFMIAGVVILHVWALHVTGQTNPTGVEVKSKTDTVPFTPYATVKDAFALSMFFMVFAYFIFFMPNFLGHADNYIEANPLVTPAHIVPEWYFLPFYAILRAITFDIGPIDSKLGGVLAMFGSIAVLFVLPWLDTSKVRSAVYRPWYKLFFWMFVANAIFSAGSARSRRKASTPRWLRSRRSTTLRSSWSSCRCWGLSKRRSVCLTRSQKPCSPKRPAMAVLQRLRHHRKPAAERRATERNRRYEKASRKHRSGRHGVGHWRGVCIRCGLPDQQAA
jgi:quinol-cytochrome oxidoreductase complex cytochrome b subunit